MASAKIIESTSKVNGVRTTTRNINSFVVYRHKDRAVRPKIVSAAYIFLENKNNYTYSHSGNPFKGISKITGEVIASTRGAICCTALCSAAIAAAQGKKQGLHYNQTPANFNRIGYGSSSALEPGDILCRNPTGSTGGHWMVYVGSSKGAPLSMDVRLRYPEYENDWFFKKAKNPFCDGSNGPDGLYHNCTWYAYGRFNEIAGKRCSLPTGNAQSWYNSYVGKKGKTPKLGAVACFSGGSYGHVAIVERIFDDEDILISNSAYNSGSPNRKPTNNEYTYKCSSEKDDNGAYPFFYTRKLSHENGWDYDNTFKLQGFIYQDVNYEGITSGTYGTGYVALDLHQTSSQLKSSDSYKYVYAYDEEPDLLKRKEKGDDSLYQYDIQGINSSSKTREFLMDFLYGEGKTGTEVPSDDIVANYVYNYATGSSARRPNIQSRVRVSPGILPVTDAVVIAPFVELDFGNDNVIGSYLSKIDRYPNHIKSMSVEKVNGEINKYTFNIIHQIRPGEDPNLLDKVFSTVRYDYITLRYGDAAARTIYTDEKLIITDIVMDRNYAEKKITYTVYATSACSYITSYKMDFPAVFDKPSNQILKLLYDDPVTSPLLLEAFPGMANRTEVESKGLIPTNDRAIEIEAQTDISPWERIQTLVSLLSMAVRVGGDFIGVAATTTIIAGGEMIESIAGKIINKTVDKVFDEIGAVAGTVVGAAAGGIVAGALTGGIGTIIGAVGGAAAGWLLGDKIGSAIKSVLVPTVNAVDTTLGMIIGLGTAAIGNKVADALDWVSNKIETHFLIQDDDKFYVKAIRRTSSSEARLGNLTNTLFEVTVGYPGDECITDFQIHEDSSWAILSQKGILSDEYVYAINRDGVSIKKYSPNLFSTGDTMTSIEQAWYEFMLTFPVSATMKIKGLVKPTKLMDYIIVNVNFYGMTHITSGLYVITAEQEILSENGFTTQLTLLRVENE